MALHSGHVHHQGLLKTVKSCLCRHLFKVACDLTIGTHHFSDGIAGDYSELPYDLFIYLGIHLCQHIKCIIKDGSFLFWNRQMLLT